MTVTKNGSIAGGGFGTGGGSTGSAEFIRDQLESLSGEDRLNVESVKDAAKILVQPTGQPYIELPDSSLSYPIKNYTYATLPTPANYIGVAYVTDVGNGTLFKSNGVNWSIVGGETILAKGTAAITHTGTTTETNIVSVPVFGGLIGPSGSIVVETKWTLTNNSNAKTAVYKYGAIGMNSVVMSGVRSTGNRMSFDNRGETTQIASNGSYDGAQGQNWNWAVRTADTQTNFLFSISATLENAADSAVLESYVIKLIR